MGTKKVYVFELTDSYAGGLFFVAATTQKQAHKVIVKEYGTYECIGTITQLEAKVLKEGTADYTMRE